jgi:hypothetical protein
MEYIFAFHMALRITAIIFVNSISQLVFAIDMQFVFSEVGTVFLNDM